MSANTWFIISLVGYFSAAVLLIISVILYFRLGILDVIGDLTGRTVAKELKNMQENRKSGTRSSGKSIQKSGKSVKASKLDSKYGNIKTAARTGGKTSGKTSGSSNTIGRRKGTGGTATIGSGYADNSIPDIQVLHSHTGRLSNETEMLYEDFDPRVEYAQGGVPERTSEGTQILSSATELLPDNYMEEEAQAKHGGTSILEEEPTGKRGGTALLEEEPTGKRRGTALLEKESTGKRRGTALLEEESTGKRRGTALLEEESTGKRRGTTLLEELPEYVPVKFSITRSYLVIHTEEIIQSFENNG